MGGVGIEANVLARYQAPAFPSKLPTQLQPLPGKLVPVFPGCHARQTAGPRGAHPHIGGSRTRFPLPNLGKRAGIEPALLVCQPRSPTFAGKGLVVFAGGL